MLAAFRDLTLPQFAVMTVFGVLAWLASGLLFTALVHELSPLRGTASYLILGGIGASVPLGPWNMGVLWVVVRGWGVPNHSATSGIALYGVINILGRLALPMLALVAGPRPCSSRSPTGARRSRTRACSSRSPCSCAAATSERPADAGPDRTEPPEAGPDAAWPGQ